MATKKPGAIRREVRVRKALRKVAGGRPRLSIFRSSAHIYAQVIDDKRGLAASVLGTGEQGRYLTALTFGNVHGVYKPGSVKLRPEKCWEGAAVTVRSLPGSVCDSHQSSSTMRSTSARNFPSTAESLSRFFALPSG